MKNLVTITLLLFSMCSTAQSLLKTHPKESNPPKKEHFNAYSFQVANECHIGVSNSEPNTMLKFLSKNNGGLVLKRVESDDSGNFTDTYDESEMPAFVSNNGFVQFFNEHEFRLENINLKDLNSSFSISFNAVANHEDNVSYAVYSVDKNNTETLLVEIPASLNEKWEPIVFSIEKSINVNYILKVYSDNDVRYTKRLFLTDIENAYHIYPTYTNSSINIDFMAELYKGEFTIITSNGQIVKKGQLTTQLNTIDVGQLVSGNYFIQVVANGKPLQTANFIKN